MRAISRPFAIVAIGILIAVAAIVSAPPFAGATPAAPSAALATTTASQARSGSIAAENQQPGSTSWHSAALTRGAPVGDDADETAVAKSASAAAKPAAASSASSAGSVWSDSKIRGYADQASVNRGDAIRFMVGTAQPSYDLEVYRMGFYGGAGAHLITAVRGLTGHAEAVPAADPATGLIEAHWPVAYTLQTGADWVSGIYLAKLIAANGNVSYIIFVVRADGAPADIVYQLPLATYQAYNNWGGKSLYDFNSVGGVPAVKVSYDRPYTDWDGAGDFFDGDYSMVRFLEEKGYNVTYVTSVDLHASASVLNGRKVFLSNFHDEYWSRPMRQALTEARDHGMNVAFFDANDVSWQIRFEASSTGTPNRVEICYKNASTDPVSSTNPSLTTVHWADPPVNQPENALVGGMIAGVLGSANGDYAPGRDWVVQNAGNWVYAGTGLTDGAVIPKLVGYEYDAIQHNGADPAGLIALSNSPVDTTVQNSTLYTAASGAIVFSAGTIYWCRELDNNDYLTGADARVQRMTANILDRMIANAGGTPTPTPSPTPSPTPTATPSPTPTPAGGVAIFTDALAAGWVNYSWNTTVNLGATNPVYAGSKSLGFTVTNAYGGLYLHTATGVDTSGLNAVSFALYASQAGQMYGVTLQTTGDTPIGTEVLLANAGGNPVAGAWKLYTIPLSAFGAAGATIGGLTIQDEGNKAEPAAYVDELRLTGTSTPCTPTRADITSPSGGSISNSMPTLQWGGGGCITAYWLYAGSSFGTADLFSSGQLPPSATSATITPAIPVDGRMIYVRLWSLVNGGWLAVDRTYVMTTCYAGTKADVSSPAPGTLHGASQTFQWTGGACVTEYWLYLGSAYGSADLYSSGALGGTVTAQTVSNLPVNGSTVYLRLWSLVSGTWQAVDRTYVTGP